MGPRSGLVLTAGLALVAINLWAEVPFDPHGSPDTGVLRDSSLPRGACEQCHPVHGDSWDADPKPSLLFTFNNNQLAFWSEGDGPCHQGRPDNYPLEETDRLPSTEPDAGYFEANSGGGRTAGVRFRGRWPGEAIYLDTTELPGNRFVSPHAHDQDMPRKDGSGQGLCLNCHDPHGTPNPRDLLVAPYGGIGGDNAIGPPEQYRLCFNCHGPDGPSGMEPENRYLADYYDQGLNGDTAGHQIRMNPVIALSWPPHVRRGDMLPCYDCHNPHGSEGYNGIEPNGFLISDQRPGWSGLTDTVNDPEQCRRFCLGCHIPSDGIPGTQEVEGILMNTLSEEPGHASMDLQSCNACHGASYDASTAYNVHNPRDLRLDPIGPGTGHSEDVEEP